MTGEYKFFAELALAIDDGGGMDIADYGLQHGVRGAQKLFADWLRSELKQKRANARRPPTLTLVGGRDAC